MFFIGRERELEQLHRLKRLKKSSLVVIKGRRRIGKSTLVKEFAKTKKYISLVGNPPGPGITAQMQRDEFANQLCVQFNLPRVTFSTWTDAFRFLGMHLKEQEIIILFDEISWMGDLDPNFLGSLKTWWDQCVNENNRWVLILCGSISTWIEENILSSTGFVGRITLVIHLKPLSLLESISFLRKKGVFGSAYELLQLLSVTGGIPWYLDLIDPKETVSENIQALCFEPTGRLGQEFKIIFHDLFDNRGEAYRNILQHLVEGMKTQKELRELLHLEKGGTISEYLGHLVEAGFISEHYQWSLKTGRAGKQKLYRLSDCFIRFHLKYVAPYQEQIRQGGYKSRERLPGWDSIMGFQLESLLLSNRDLLLQALGIDMANVVCDNPFWQQPTDRKKGCQVDYLIQMKFQSVIVVEFKFRRNELSSSVITEIKEKCDALSVPRGFGKVPALFHVGGVSPKVEESTFFYKVIDLRVLLDLG